MFMEIKINRIIFSAMTLYDVKIFYNVIKWRVKMGNTDKITRILILYYRLSRGECISKAEFSIEHGITERTFDRDIEDIRIFLSEIYTSKELIFDRERKVYHLTGCYEIEISVVEICAIIKILISSRAFNDEEMKGLVSAISELIPLEKKKTMDQLIYSEINNYKQLEHGKAILKMNWDLNKCILKQKKIKLLYYKATGEKVSRIVLPISVIFSEFYFYLIAFIEDKDYDFPAFFRIDRIESFEVMDEVYSRSLYQKYSVGEMKNSIQFMYAGELTDLKLKCKISSLEAVLDRLPNAEIIDKDAYVILKARIFGQGIVKWILSQGDNIEVLEPAELREKIIDETMKIINLYQK